MGPAKVRMVISGDAPEGERYMRVSDVERGRAEIFSDSFLSADKIYIWSLWAKGEKLAGAGKAPQLLLLTYDYGRNDTGRRTNLGRTKPLGAPVDLTPEWEKYEGEFSLDREGAVDFRFVLGFTAGSSVDIDEVVVVRKALLDDRERRMEGE